MEWGVDVGVVQLLSCQQWQGQVSFTLREMGMGALTWVGVESFFYFILCAIFVLEWGCACRWDCTWGAVVLPFFCSWVKGELDMVGNEADGRGHTTHNRVLELSSRFPIYWGWCLPRIPSFPSLCISTFPQPPDTQPSSPITNPPITNKPQIQLICTHLCLLLSQSAMCRVDCCWLWLCEVSAKVKVVQWYSKWVLLATVGLVGKLMDDVDVSHLCVVERCGGWDITWMWLCLSSGHLVGGSI